VLTYSLDDVSAAAALFVNSETLELTAHAACPVVAWRGDVVRPDTRPVLLDVDHVNGAPTALAFEFADRFAAPLVAVHGSSTRRLPGHGTTPRRVDRDAVESDEPRLLGEALAPWR